MFCENISQHIAFYHPSFKLPKKFTTCFAIFKLKNFAKFREASAQLGHTILYHTTYYYYTILWYFSVTFRIFIVMDGCATHVSVKNFPNKLPITDIYLPCADASSLLSAVKCRQIKINTYPQFLRSLKKREKIKHETIRLS